ncbi:hypothetical protein DICA3_C03994 [Diutina catenulata]
MKLAYLLALLPAFVAADKTFGAMTVRTGTQFQFGQLSLHNGVVHVNDGAENLKLVLKNDGTLYDSNSKKYLVLNQRGELTAADKGSTKFKINDVYLQVEGANGYYVCPNNEKKYVVGTKECNGGTNVAIYVDGVKDAGSKPAPATKTVTLKPPKTLITKTVHPITTTIKGVTKTVHPITTVTLKPTVVPAAKQFGLISIHSGSNVQNLGIKKVDSHVHVFSVGGSEGKDLFLTLSSDGTLFDQDGRGIFVGENGDVGNVDPWGKQRPTGGFSVKDGNLLYQGQNAFYACPSGPNGKYSLTVKGWNGCTGIALKTIAKK